MKAISAIAEGFLHWIDAVAGTLVTWRDWLAAPRVVKLVEDEAGALALQADWAVPGACPAVGSVWITDDQIVRAKPADIATTLSGSRVELILRPGRFLFRPLELPSRATEFLEGIVRAQIDRLTPWTATEAAFGWSKSTGVGADRIVVMIAATARASLIPYLQAIANAGADSIAVFTAGQEPGVDVIPIKVWQDGVRSAVNIGRIRQALITVLVVIGSVAAVALAASEIIGISLDAEHAGIAHQIASVRAAAGATHETASGAVAAAERTLAQRKKESPVSVIVLETLSQILPDHTYLTELRIEGNKLRIVGITRDAPMLIGLIEQSARFSRATFFAPTMRSSSDQGERFHIEAAIQPLAASPL
jgi:general secretion pathway protein L